MKKALSFKRLFKEGKTERGEDFSLKVLENNLGISRLGISIQAKIFPKAIQRNRIKRLIRNFFRRYKHNLVKDYDIIVIPKNLDLAKINYKQLEENLLALFKRAGLMK